MNTALEVSAGMDPGSRARSALRADRLLGRDGRMVRAIESIGRGVEAFEGVPFRLPIDVER